MYEAQMFMLLGYLGRQTLQNSILDWNLNMLYALKTAANFIKIFYSTEGQKCAESHDVYVTALV